MNQNLPPKETPTPGKSFFSILTEFMDRMVRALLNIKDKLFTRTPNTTQTQGIVSASGISTRTKTIVTALAAVFFILIIAVFVVSYLKGRIQKPKEEEKVGEKAVTTIVERKASRYATDEAVLKMEADTKVLEEEINKGDIEEKSLTPPTLNFDVNFQE